MRKQATMKDVASVLGMHKSTVSLALSGKGTISQETRQRIRSVARDMGYEPSLLAQRLARGQSENGAVGVFSGVLDAGLATEKILLIQKLLNAESLEAPLYTSGDAAVDDGAAQAAQVKQICRQRPRALICAVQRIHPAVYRELSEYQKRGGVVISYDTPIELPCDQIIFDREDNAYRAARHLLEMGHRKIGLGMSQFSGALTDQPTNAHSDPQRHRLYGFERALSEFGLTLRPEWFFRNTTYERGGAEMARQFLALIPSERPTALAIVNDYVTLAFMVEVMRAGIRIPQDLSVVGHDNQPIAEYCPVPLSSMTQPAERIAQAVTDALLERLSGDVALDAPPRIRKIEGEFIARESVLAIAT